MSAHKKTHDGAVSSETAAVCCDSHFHAGLLHLGPLPLFTTDLVLPQNAHPNEVPSPDEMFLVGNSIEIINTRSSIPLGKHSHVSEGGRSRDPYSYGSFVFFSRNKFNGWLTLALIDGRFSTVVDTVAVNFGFGRIFKQHSPSLAVC